MAIEDFIQQATDEIEAQKPINKDINGVVSELTDEEYTEKINNLAAVLDDEAQNGWLKNRLEQYPSLQDCIHALLDGGQTLADLQAARQLVKDNNPKPSE